MEEGRWEQSQRSRRWSLPRGERRQGPDSAALGGEGCEESLPVTGYPELVKEPMALRIKKMCKVVREGKILARNISHKITK